MRYLHTAIFAISLMVILVLSSVAFASTPTNERPEYIVTYKLSQGLKSPQFLFTEQGFKLVPPYLKTSSSLPIGKLDKRNLITVHSAKTNLKYCDKEKQFCWPKTIELDGTYIRFTSHEGTHRFALDTSNLHRTLWNAFYDNYKKSNTLGE